MKALTLITGAATVQLLGTVFCSGPLAQPVTEPQPACHARVYFDFDTSNLTDKAQEIVSLIVRCVKRRGGHVNIVGSAAAFESKDPDGDPSAVGLRTYAQMLSERRAEAVKDEMIREGLDGNIIHTSEIDMRLPAPGRDQALDKFADISVTSSSLVFPRAAQPRSVCSDYNRVYFYSDSTDLMNGAQEAVSRIVSCIKQKGGHVSIVGHATLKESESALNSDDEEDASQASIPLHAQAVSERRAQSIKDEMVRQGLDSNTIRTSGIGMRLEAPELDEVHNRYAEVTVTR